MDTGDGLCQMEWRKPRIVLQKKYPVRDRWVKPFVKERGSSKIHEGGTK